MAGKIIVVGSFVYDLIVWVPYFPRKGETLLASDFKMAAGGKGFNQAVTARRCGAEVSLMGKVGTDQFGEAFMEIMQQEGIDHSFVIMDRSTSTSLGIPMIDPSGNNSIIGVPRANTLVTAAQVEAARDFITRHDTLLLQLEIPLEASLHAARIAHQAGKTVIFNPAPAIHPLSLLLARDGAGEPLVDWFIPNEVEAEMLSGMPVHSLEDVFITGRSILSRGVRKGVIITMGELGAVVCTASGDQHIPAFPITPVDPTGAGDAFCGAFAAAITEGQSLGEALRFANASGALSATIAGAEPSLPRRAAVESFLEQYPGSPL